jgi:alpha-mannosidase
MEVPAGLRWDCAFLAANVPPCGYKTYRLVRRERRPAFPSAFTRTETTLENGSYRITVDPGTGHVCSIFDKEAGAELLDADAPHNFGELVVRAPDRATTWQMGSLTVSAGVDGPVFASLERTGSVHAHPIVRETITIYAGLRRLDLAVRVLKEAAPLLDVSVAFPFTACQPRFRYEGVLSIMDPITDFLPGAYSDSLPVQNWAKMADNSHCVLWASLDAPIASFGGLWPGYVSPAHACLVRQDYAHPPLRVEDLQQGWIYSTIFMNNFGTNFSVAQTGDFLFRYSLTSQAGDAADSTCVRFGSEVALPLQPIFTKHPRPRILPAAAGLLEIDRPEVVLVTCKQAEDGRGHIIRLWNTAPKAVPAQVRIGFANVAEVSVTDLGERDSGATVPHADGVVSVALPPRAVTTLRLV